jgi:hypothetical protein
MDNWEEKEIQDVVNRFKVLSADSKQHMYYALLNADVNVVTSLIGYCSEMQYLHLQFCARAHEQQSK